MIPENFNHAKQIIEKIEGLAEEAFIVGGAIRNYIYGYKINDIDIATSASPKMIMNLFSRVIDIASDHGTVMVIYENETYEVTTFRGNKRTIVDDLQYRDFTMNAIAMDKKGNVIDPFHGIDHIKQNRLVAVMDANARIEEDPLRIVRAFRFISELQCKLDDELYDAIQKKAHLLEMVSIERMIEEWFKCLKGKYMKEAVQLIHELNIYTFVPLINKKLHTNLLEQTVAFQTDEEIVTYLAYYAEENEIKQYVKKWKLSNKLYHNAINLLNYIHRYYNDGMDKILLYEIDRELFCPFIRLLERIERKSFASQHAKWLNDKKQLPIQHRAEINFSGHELLKLNPQKRPGKWVGDTLRKIEIAIINEELENDKTKIKEWLQCQPPDKN